MNTALNRWGVFEAVVQLGRIAAAASKTNRSQPTISYAISHPQDQFKILLFEVKGRRAKLTEAGKARLTDAQPLLRGFKALEQRASWLAAGCERRICPSVDSSYPDGRLLAALAELTRLYPRVHPPLHRTTLALGSWSACGCLWEGSVWHECSRFSENSMRPAEKRISLPICWGQAASSRYSEG
jgi:DNA-binding transcriptional LysR family regulator